MKISMEPQGSAAWLQSRLGVITASEASALVTPQWAIRKGEGVETYLYRKLAEKLMGYAPDAGESFAMQQGSLIESIALPWYSFQYDVQVRRVGFCVSDDGRTGCSPDGLVGDDMGLEIKCPTPPIHLKYLLGGEVPPEYRPQVQFSLWVTGLPRWRFISYSRHFDPLVVDVAPEPEAQTAIQEAVAQFLKRFDAALFKLQAREDEKNALLNAQYLKENPA